MSRRRLLVLASAAVGSVLLASRAEQAWAQPSWPIKALRLVLPFAAGSSADIVARALAPELQRNLGQPVLLENKPGAGGNSGAAEVARAAADGYTLLLGTVSTQAINTSLYAKMPFDPAQDFAAVTLLASVPLVLVMNPGSAQKYSISNLRELINTLKTQPGKLSIASSGNGSSSHLTGELFKTMAGTFILHLPFRGSGPALADLMAGEVDLMFESLPSAMPHIKSGRLKALAVSSAERSGAMPELPTIAQAGGPTLKSFEASDWFGLLVAAGTPAEVVQRLQRESVSALASPAMKEKLLSLGAIPGGGTAEAFAAQISAETLKWARVVRTSNVRLD